MFEDETVDLPCPRCGHRNSILVREFEAASEFHIVCKSCKVAVKIEAGEFRQRLDEVRRELEDLQRDADRGVQQAKPRPKKDDYQI